MGPLPLLFGLPPEPFIASGVMLAGLAGVLWLTPAPRQDPGEPIQVPARVDRDHRTALALVAAGGALVALVALSAAVMWGGAS